MGTIYNPNCYLIQYGSFSPFCHVFVTFSALEISYFMNLQQDPKYAYIQLF